MAVKKRKATDLASVSHVTCTDGEVCKAHSLVAEQCCMCSMVGTMAAMPYMRYLPFTKSCRHICIYTYTHVYVYICKQPTEIYVQTIAGCVMQVVL